jgi:hypothetical protein
VRSGEKRLNGARCSATTKAGKPCRALAGADGKCTAHSGKMDMRELGRKSGEARRRPNPERVPESLRDELRNLDPNHSDVRVTPGGLRAARGLHRARRVDADCRVVQLHSHDHERPGDGPLAFAGLHVAFPI